MKYWVYKDGEVPGSFTPEELATLPGFSMTTLVCPAEGEILEKNWRRSGEFPDIIPHMREKNNQLKPSPAAAQVDAAPTVNIDALLDSTETRLFGHVAQLMKDIDSRREERALLDSLQNRLLEAENKSRAQQLSLESRLGQKEEALSALRLELENSRNDLAQIKGRLSETANELEARNRLAEKLNGDLAAKEIHLAKSLAMIQRLEQALQRLPRQDGR